MNKELKYRNMAAAFRVLFITALVIMSFFTGCRQDYSPKPRGYFRIDFPDKEYARFDTTYPYSFEYPVYANVIPDTRPESEPYWVNIEYPQYKGRIYISYKPVDENLNDFLEDSRTFVIKHIPKADAIDDSLVYLPENRVYGLIYYIEGSQAASPCQFFVTDSASRFLRGALYFSVTPNNDSLAPVIDFIEEDIRQMIRTFKWK